MDKDILKALQRIGDELAQLNHTLTTRPEPEPPQLVDDQTYDMVDGYLSRIANALEKNHA